MVGNVWEWVSEVATDGAVNGRTLPTQGYVAGLDGDGLVYATNDAPQPEYFNDYLWVDHQGVRGIFRGGFWSSGDRAGQYAVNVTVPPTFVGEGVGFRCAQ